MAARNFDDWLAAFVEYASIGEAPLHIIYWVGVSTIAGALRRRVWIDEIFFQWIPNFYVVVVAEPGIVAKSTTANIGFNLLRQVDGINFGPDIVTWQRLIEKMGATGETFEIDGINHPMHAMTCAIDELGNFIDPEDDKQISALIALWDGKKGAFEKETKTQGNDKLVNPWLNWFACTTPNWVGRNFPEAFLDSGLFSRMIFLTADGKRQRVPYLSRQPRGDPLMELRLVADLKQIAALAGPYKLTDAAYVYGDAHYNAHWDKHTADSREWLGYPARKQTHMHKLAMIISAARGNFPIIDVSHLEEAERQLAQIEPQIHSVFNVIGARDVPKAAQQLVAALEKEGGRALRRVIYNKYFFRRLSSREFDEALRSAVAANLVGVSPTAPVGLWLISRGLHEKG